MKRIMLTALHSGSGKTVMACAFLRALSRRGLSPEGFKCGPDYIDPMFHRRVLGVPSHNLDLFLQGEDGLRRTLSGSSGGIAVLEAAMGFFDGIGGTEQGSGWHIASLTDTPAVLILRPAGVGITLAAQIKGVMAFRPPNRIAGLLLNCCRESLYEYLRPVLERETGLPVLGCLPQLPEAVLESRHLGLVTADEITDFSRRIDVLADALEAHCDIPALLALCAEGDPGVSAAPPTEPRCTIAVARDAAFCFYYEESLRALEQAGARLVSFSPLTDPAVPESDALYLGGGYPELYAARLSENAAMRASVRQLIEQGLPAIAECGGFLYLQKELAGHPMAGVFCGSGFDTGRLQRFGYATLTARENSLLFRAGERIPCHEFHHWDTTANGAALRAEKADGRAWDCGFCTDTLYAGFPHLHFGGGLPLADRFVSAAAAYRRQQKGASI